MINTRQSQLNSLIQTITDKAIHYRQDGHQMMSPTGRQQNWLIDLRPILLDMAAVSIICDLFWDEYEEKLPFQIGGMEVAAVPLVTALLMSAKQRGIDLNGFIIRKERKASGLGKIIEGDILDLPIILVDDIMNSGASLEKARIALEQAGYSPSEVFVLLNFDNPVGQHWAQEQKIAINQLTNLDPFDVEMSYNAFVPPPCTYKVMWRYYEPGAFPHHNVPKSTPLLQGDYIYMGTEIGKMICVNRHDGNLRWEFDTKTHHPKGIWSSPAYHDGKIYFGAYNGIFYCLNAETGQEIWRNSCCEFIGSSPLIVPEHNMLYIGLEHQRPRQMGSNAALKLDTGARVWEQGQKKYQHGSAAYYQPMDIVVFGNADHDISAYDAKTGKLVWKHETIRSIKYPPAVDEDLKIVVAASFDGNIYILDVETGDQKAAIKTNDICYSTPLITQGKIFCGSGDRHMYVIDANTYELIKKIDVHAKAFSSPRLINNKVVFGTAGGRIIELSPDTLEIYSHAQLPDSITNAIASDEQGQYFYASTIMNEICAIQRVVVHDS